MIRLLRDSGNKVYLPRVNGEILEVVEYKEDVVTDKLYEPNGQAVFPDLDVVIVPIVAYDKNKAYLCGDFLFTQMKGNLEYNQQANTIF